MAVARFRMVCDLNAPSRIRRSESPASGPSSFWSSSSLISISVPNFRTNLDSAELPTVTALKPELLQLQQLTCALRVVKTNAGTRAPPKNQCVSKYPQGKRAFKILSDACVKVWLARARKLLHSQLWVVRSRRACF
ncbi:hypothetical protein RF11_08994 [Thelohanellus kitauei]|uniref:Uncharacterized protein n=1 Tax=Thelohanellus kitauei TaxID=669202 RepID=A0A0C2J137_THEKT|nr:hypothetical protein RF11_08994 [Thelohanellus kitauei]